MSDAGFSAAAQAFLEYEAGRLPDLSAITVLVPHFHAAQAFRQALRAHVAQAVFIPPRLMTLPALAATAPGADEVEAESRRLAEIYRFLDKATELPDDRRWAAAAELADLMRELSEALLSPPAHYAEFVARLESAYRRRLCAPMAFEARLAFELWHALQSARLPDASRDYAQRLAWLAERAQTPLYRLGLNGLSPLEERFFARHAERAPVRDLPWRPHDAARAQFLRPPHGAGAMPPASPFAGALRLYAANDREDEAQACARQILAWLAEGRPRIGVLVLDRASARRLRALLERHAVLVQDETGWTLATVAVSHVLDRWFAVLQDDAYFRDLLDLLKSPYLFADLDPAERLAAVAELEQRQRREGLIEGLERFRRLAQATELPAAVIMLERIAQAARSFDLRQRLTLAAWQGHLLAALDTLGATPALAADLAGAQLLQLLRRLQAELSGEASTYRFGEWRQWLRLHLDQATFVDTRIDSPVCFTHLRAARGRPFDAAILLGADATRLPERPQAGLFNEAVRAELGLAGLAWRDALLREALEDVLCRAPSILVTWQAHKGVEPNALSPWLEWLNLRHRAEYGLDLRAGSTLAALAPAPLAARPTLPPRPVCSEWPARVSVSAWQSLVACPYQFYARHCLGLNALDEALEEMDKRDYGTLLHKALAAFHRQHPRLSGVAREILERDLAAALGAAFAARRNAPYLAEAWRLRWQRRQAAYLDWALGWEGAGHRFDAAEVPCAVEVAVAGRPLRLEGRLDRVDQGPDGAVVLDYKTHATAALRAKLKTPGEDVQLPAYAWLARAQAAAFVALDGDEVATLGWSGDLTAAARREAERFSHCFAALAAGAPLPAHGSAAVCGHCEMRGLCRRDHWASPEEAAQGPWQGRQSGE